jgi:acyl transferase domain-containing protein
MSDIGQRLAKLTEVQLTAFAREFEEARREVRRLTEPVAIVGMACRFPGRAEDADSFWSLLRSGADVSGDVPPGRRWSEEVGSRGYFLPDPHRFDAALFGISPREARTIDPQHRMLLELAWQALETAGYPPRALDGARCGVFAGCYADDHAHQLVWSGRVDAVDAHTSTGTSHSAGAGRVAYHFNFRGPAICFDSACSSSLVAVHSACEALRGEDCDFALAGGVSLSLTAATTLALNRARMLSADGRSRAFDQEADGYARGEGGGLVMLRRLSDAERDGDPILAVIHGSAMNHNGRASSLTSPSGEAQADVIRRALRKARVLPDDIDMIECFAAGSPLGDAIEVGALRRIFAGRDREDPIILGSVKSNIGHLEAASGIASLIKVVLALRHGEVPASLNIDAALNPAFEEDGAWMSVARAPRDWPAGKRRLAGVSAFGFGGTNVHMIVGGHGGAAPAAGEAVAPGRLLAVSDREPGGIAARARAYAEALGSGCITIGELCRTVNSGRAQHPHRALVAAETEAEALAGLERLASGDAAAVSPRGGDRERALAFVFVGQGAQFPGMGRALYERIPSFREALDRCDRALSDSMGCRLFDLLWGSDRDLLAQTRYAQPAIFAHNYAFAEMLRSMGVVPTALIGHSLGEYVAAQYAGVFNLEEALSLVVDRGRLMGELPAGGAMAALAINAVGAARLAQNAGLDVAACNGPRQFVLSGDEEAIDTLLRQPKLSGTRLEVSHAFHSRLMDAVLPAFARRLEACRLEVPTLPVYSNLTAQRETDLLADPSYWVRHLRETVRFAPGLAAALADGHTRFVEIGPRSTLGALVAKIGGPEVEVHGAPGPGGDPLADLSRLLGACFLAGHPVDWAQIQKAYGGGKVYLAPAPMGGEALENRVAASGETRLARALAEARAASPAGARMTVPGTGIVLHRKRIGEDLDAVRDHRLRGVAVLPAAYFLASATAVLQETAGAGPWAIRGAHFAEPLLLDMGEDRELLTRSTPHLKELSIDTYSRSGSDGEAVQHAALTAGLLGAATAGARRPFPSALDPIEDFYERMRACGYEWGPSFRWLSDIRAGGGVAGARLNRPFGIVGEDHFHPGFYDSAFQLMAATAGFEISPASLLVPAAVDEVVIWPGGAGYLHAIATVDRALCTADTLFGNIVVYDGNGFPSVTINGFCARRIVLGAIDAMVPELGITVSSARRERPERKAQSVSLGDPDEHRRRVLSAPPGERSDQLAIILAGELARILELPACEVDTSRSLHALGVDSMMALEFKTLLERSFSIHLPVSEFLDGPSLGDVADAVLARIENDEGASDDALATLDVTLFSDSQVEALLAEMVGGAAHAG